MVYCWYKDLTMKMFSGQKDDNYDGTNFWNFPSVTFFYVNTSKLYLTSRLAT